MQDYFSSVCDAAYHTVHSYPGGAVSLAPRLGMKSAATLNHKVNPHSPTYYLGLKEAQDIQRLTGDHRILFTSAHDLGYACIKVTSEEVANVNQNCLATMQEMSAYLKLVTETLADNVVSDNELSQNIAQLGIMIGEANNLLSVLIGMNQRNKIKPSLFIAPLSTSLKKAKRRG